MAVVATTVAGGVRIRIFFFDEQSSGFGVEGDVGGGGPATFSIAPAQGGSHDDDDDGQKNQSCQPQNKPREGFIF